jgi:hypothetical protein
VVNVSVREQNNVDGCGIDRQFRPVAQAQLFVTLE